MLIDFLTATLGRIQQMRQGMDRWPIAAGDSWAELRASVVAFDFETTGIDTNTAAIVQAAVVGAGGGEWQALAWPDNATGWPRVPEGAAKVHGITDRVLLTEGAGDAAALLRGFCDAVTACNTSGQPVSPMAFNGLHYDVPLLHTVEARVLTPRLSQYDPSRGELASLVRYDNTIDPFVVGSVMFRGSLKATNLQAMHTWAMGEAFGGAHDALEDVRATLRLFWWMVERFDAAPETRALANRAGWLRFQKACAEFCHEESWLFGPWFRLDVATGEVQWRMKRRAGDVLDPSEPRQRDDLLFAARKSRERNEHPGVAAVLAAAKRVERGATVTLADVAGAARELGL